MFLVTGHNGFIAKNFIPNLYRKKIIKVKRDLKKIDQIKNNTIKIINFAAFYQKETSFKDLDKLIDANYTYPIKIIQKLIENGNKVIFFNICSFFQLKNNFKNKSNLYSSVKNSFKEVLKFYSKSKKFKSYDIYFYDIFGYGDKREKLFNSIVNSYKNKSILKISNLSAEMVPVHINEVTNILKKFIQDKKRSNEIHINHGKKIKVNEILNIAKKIYPNLKIMNKKNIKKNFKIFYKKPYKYNYNKNLNYLIESFFKKFL
jgi:nucleoside-diphosphate-sugar epimerase